MSQRDQQSRSRTLTARQVLDLRIAVEIECLTQFLGVLVVPVREERLRVPHQLADPHPIRKVTFLGQIADAAQRADGILNRIETEDSHRSRLSLEHSQDVFDERRLAGSVAADQAEHTAARHAQRQVIERRLVAELPCHSANLDDRRRGRGKGFVHDYSSLRVDCIAAWRC